MEWLEAEGESVDDAVKAALLELGLDSTEDVDVEVLREPKKGFLGLGGQMALVKVTRKEQKRRRRRRGRGSRSNDDTTAKASSSRGQKSNQGKASDGSKSSGTRQKSGGRSGSGSRSSGSGSSGSRSSGSGSRSSRSGGGSSQSNRNRPNNNKSSEKKRPSQEAAVNDNKGDDKEQASIEEQADVAVEFLRGLVDSFGLEGEVTSKIDDDILYLDVSGDTEALVGAKGAIMQSVLELARTVVQRKTYGAPRMRIDIAGYAERRREALTIYAGRLAEKVIEEGGEVMLEPMNPADRKVVHDAIAEIDGVRSFSEGEDPNRSVVVAPAD